MNPRIPAALLQSSPAPDVRWGDCHDHDKLALVLVLVLLYPLINMRNQLLYPP
jgi:hypothetical protein